MMRLFLFTILLAGTIGLQAQTTPGSLLRTSLLQKMDSAVLLMESGEYSKADVSFREVLEKIGAIPSDLTFYFGKNSFYLNEYKQSVDWLSKYLQLKGTTGQFSAEAADLIRKSEAVILKTRIADAQKARTVLTAGYDLDCEGALVVCPVCKGQHVIIKPGPFGNTYKTCPWCSDQGTLTCEEYNLLLRGDLKPRE